MKSKRFKRLRIFDHHIDKYYYQYIIIGSLQKLFHYNLLRILIHSFSALYTPMAAEVTATEGSPQPVATAAIVRPVIPTVVSNTSPVISASTNNKKKKKTTVEKK